MKTNKTPCNECPYRKDSLPGYLGDESHNPELFLQQLDCKEMHPCHQMVDWNDYTEKDLGAASKCTGALQFMNNSFMRHRNMEVVKLQQTVGKNKDIMQFKHEFINHHK